MDKTNGPKPVTSAAMKVTVNESTKKIEEIKVVAHEGGTPSTSCAISDPLSRMSFLELDSKMIVWRQELEEADLIFIHQAQAINKTDMMLRKGQEQLVQLNKMLQQAHAVAGDIDQEYEFINSQMDGLSNFIDWIDQKHTSAHGSFTNYIPPDNSGRAALYNLIYQTYNERSQAAELLSQVLGMAQQSVGTKGVEVQQNKNLEVFQIVSILNIHMNTLQRINKNIETVIAETERVKHRAQILMQRKEF